MARYDYQAVDAAHACALCRDGFEWQQPMAEAPLAKCPQCGAPVRQVIHAPAILKHGAGRNVLSDSNVKKHGFTKLVNEGGGKFRKI